MASRAFWLAFAFLLALLAVLLVTRPAAAATCGPHDEVTAGIQQTYKEVLVDSGHVRAEWGRFFEYFSNTRTGSWTIILTDLDGQACIAAHGYDLIGTLIRPKAS